MTRETPSDPWKEANSCWESFSLGREKIFIERRLLKLGNKTNLQTIQFRPADKDVSFLHSQLFFPSKLFIFGARIKLLWSKWRVCLWVTTCFYEWLNKYGSRGNQAVNNKNFLLKINWNRFFIKQTHVYCLLFYTSGWIVPGVYWKNCNFRSKLQSGENQIFGPHHSIHSR